MKLSISDKSFFEEGVEDSFKNIVEQNMQLLDKNTTYDLKICFYNHQINGENIILLDENVAGIEVKKEYYTQTHKIRQAIEDLGIVINHVEVNGTTRPIHMEKIHMEIEEAETTYSNKKISIIPNKEVFLFKNRMHFLNKLFEKSLISENEYLSSAQELRRTYGFEEIILNNGCKQ